MAKAKITTSLACICFLLSMAGFYSLTPGVYGASDKPIELKFAHHNPPRGRTTVKFLDPYMRRIEAATHGRVKIIAYPAQTLAKSRETFAAIEGGVADMGWFIPGDTPGRFPLSEVFQLPFICTNSGEKNGRIMQMIYEKFPSIQKEYSTIKLLFVMGTAPFFVATRDKPVRTVADLRGLKLRVIGTMPVKAMRRLGVTPVTLPMPDVYEAAEKGVIDGALTMWAQLPTFNLQEVLNYWTNVPLWPAITAVGMNLDKWNSLPRDIQDEIMSVSGVTGAEFAGRTGWGPDIQAEVYAKMKKTGDKFQEVDMAPAEVEKMKEIAGKPIWEEWVKAMEKRGAPARKILDGTLKIVEREKDR